MTHPAPPDDPPDEMFITDAVRAARRGFRTDVARLLGALGSGRLYVPLSRPVAGVEPGVEVQVGEELSLSPHLIQDEQSLLYLPVFTRPAWVEELGEQLGWRTDDGPLEYCALPGEILLEIALNVVDAERVMGLLIDPMRDSELMLQRHEVASIAQNRPIPLVGYVSQLPPDASEKPLISELDEPISKDVVRALEELLAAEDPAPQYVLKQTFNAERDLEPHLTLNLLGVGSVTAAGQLAARIGEVLEGRLPPPGYIDIVFDDPFIR